MRLFLDANVLFTAAHNPKGKAALVLELGRAGIWLAVSSAYAVEEARRNLQRKYPERMAAFMEITRDLPLVPQPGSGVCPPCLPAKDCPIYLAALAGRAEVLLTGDVRDFGFLMNDRSKADGLLIQTVAEFLAAL